jgi:hypothetical protein
MAARVPAGEPLFQRVVEILSPYIGPTTAKASVKMFLKQDGIAPEQLEPGHLPALAARLEPGLRVFVGLGTAKALSHRVAKASGGAE